MDVDYDIVLLMRISIGLIVLSLFAAAGLRASAAVTAEPIRPSALRVAPVNQFTHGLALKFSTFTLKIASDRTGTAPAF